MVLFKCSIGCQNWVAAPGSTSRAAAADSREEPALAGTTQIQRDEHTLCSMSEGSLWSESRAAGAKPEWCYRGLDAGGQLCFWRLLWLYRSAAHRLALTFSKNSVWWPWCAKAKLCLKSTELTEFVSLHIYVGLAGAHLPGFSTLWKTFCATHLFEKSHNQLTLFRFK